MEYVKFGNAGITVSRLCLGAMNYPSTLEDSEAIRLTHEAIDHGINFIDTADAYARGDSEELLGKALKGEKRDHVVLATKFWVRMYPEDPNGGGCSRYHIMRAVEDSLRRLDTDRIDLYQLHHPDPKTPVEEVISTLDTLVKQGKVRYYGVSNHYAWQMAHMLGVSALHSWEPLVSIQCRYSILDRAIERETAPFCERFNIAIMAYSPLEGGVLTGKYKRAEEPAKGTRLAKSKAMQERMTDEVYNTLDKLEAIAGRNGIGLNQLALAWILAKPYATCPILGGSKPEHFQTLYDVCEVELPEEDIAEIDELSASRVHLPFVNQAISQGAPLAVNWW